MSTPTLSKLKFHRVLMGRRAYKEFGTMFISIGYNPVFNKDTAAGGYKGDGKNTWEVCYGALGSEPKEWTLITFAHRSNVNAILRNVHMKGLFGRMSAERDMRNSEAG